MVDKNENNEKRKKKISKTQNRYHFGGINIYKMTKKKK